MKLKAGIEGVDAAGRKASLSLEGSFKKVEGAIEKVRKGLSLLSFGSMMLDSVLSLINRFKSWREEVRKAQTELQKLENERIFAVQARGVERCHTRQRTRQGQNRPDNWALYANP